jgi:hypothetical protein
LNSLNSQQGTKLTTMTHLFEPFTPERFKLETGLQAHENEAIYLRWVNTQINYANFLQMQEMNTSLKEIIDLLKEGAFTDTTE